jgi:Zn-dependent oligopeptidase
MAATVNKQGIRRYAIVAIVILVVSIAAASVTLVVRDRNEKEMLSQLERAQSDLRTLGGQIANIKDADLTSTNDFISAYAQIEPLEKEYEMKLQQFSGLYERARERDSHRGWLDVERLRGRHHAETWEKMSEIIGLVREINEVTKRQISVVHAMASLPEPERMRFWHEQFMPLAAQEHALREQLQVVGQGRTPDPSVQ